jgi:hypothetical protein
MKTKFKLLITPISIPFQIPNYLIQKINENEFYIHRELEPGESIFYNSNQLLPYKKNLFLKQICIVTTIEKAEEIINKYWIIIKEMKSESHIKQVI